MHLNKKNIVYIVYLEFQKSSSKSITKDLKADTNEEKNPLMYR